MGLEMLGALGRVPTVVALFGSGTGPSAPPPDATVLVADDDDALRETVAFWLGERWSVREAATGTEALEKLDEAVDLLILDRRMPELPGEEVLTRLDETGFAGAVLVVSAFEPDDNLDPSRVEDYITKPIDRDQIVDHVEKYVG